jgi:hypothetical protein
LFLEFGERNGSVSLDLGGEGRDEGVEVEMEG